MSSTKRVEFCAPKMKHWVLILGNCKKEYIPNIFTHRHASIQKGASHSILSMINWLQNEKVQIDTCTFTKDKNLTKLLGSLKCNAEFKLNCNNHG